MSAGLQSIRASQRIVSAAQGWFVQLLFFSLCACASAPSATSEVPKTPDAAAHVAVWADRYRSCRTYQDSGTLREVIRPDDGSSARNSTVAFRTAFDRARGNFRFEFERITPPSSSPERAVIWRHGGGRAKSWWTITQVVREHELLDALESLAGASAGASLFVPKALLASGPLTRPDDAVQVDQETIDGAPYTKLTVQRGESAIGVWLDAQHGFRRMTRKYHVPGKAAVDLDQLELSPEQREWANEAMKRAHPFTVEETLEYTPVFDAPIEEGRFHFWPPGVPEPRT